MNTLTKEQHLAKIEHELQSVGGATGITWLGIEVSFKSLPKYRGGNIKRGNTWGVIKYEYQGQELTKEQAIEEINKPPELRQALIEAQASRECGMCGLIIVGKEALDSYQYHYFENGKFYDNQNRWSVLIVGNGGCVDICPECAKAIASGEYKS